MKSAASLDKQPSASTLASKPIAADAKHNPTREFTLEELRKHNTSALCYVSIFGKVYNLTKFLGKHPGGESVILGVAGDIADDVFTDGNHRNLKDSIAKTLKNYEVGTLKKA